MSNDCFLVSLLSPPSSVPSLSYNLHLHHPPLLSPSAPHLSHTQPEEKELLSFRPFRLPSSSSSSSIALYAGTPGPSTWQCDNVAGLFKRDPVFVKCFCPWRATTGQERGAVKAEGELWCERTDFLINLSRAGRGGFLISRINAEFILKKLFNLYIKQVWHWTAHTGNYLKDISC